jgi:GNAT superfamily N-acetyltransferase
MKDLNEKDKDINEIDQRKPLQTIIMSILPEGLGTGEGYLRYSFLIDDLRSYTSKQIVNLSTIFVPKEIRNKGIGSKMIQDIIAPYKDNSIICCSAVALITEYPENPSEEEFAEILVNVGNFLEKNGFWRCNEFLGTYDGTTSVAYVYDNQMWKDLKKEIEEKRNK